MGTGVPGDGGVGGGATTGSGSRPGTSGAGPPVTEQEIFEIRRYRPGDERAIIDLFERTFCRPMAPSGSEEHWKWEFLGNPTGKLAILLAFAGEKLAAQYTVLPLRVSVDGSEREGALSLDTATDAAFRGRGLFPRLAGQLNAELTREGTVVVFGFPNEFSAPTIFTKVGWSELKPFPLLVKALHGVVGVELSKHGAVGRILAPLGEAASSFVRRRPHPLPPGFRAEAVREFPPDADGLWARAHRGKRICVVRDRSYLQWRYVTNPDGACYRIQTLRQQDALIGYVVTKVEQRFGMTSGFVMDLLCEESRPEAAEALVSLAETATASAGAQIVTALMYPGTIARHAFEAAGFLSPPARLFPKEIHFGYRALAPDADRALLARPEHWFVTWGDSDVV